MPGYLQSGAPDPDAAYTVSITCLRVRRPRGFLRFLRAAGPVVGQIGDAPGVVAHGVKINLGRLEFLTYGAFSTRPDLGRFTSAGPHGEVFRALRGRLGPIAATRLKLTGRELPTDWGAIEALLAGGAVS